MASFDNLPSARNRKPAAARDAPTAPKPSKSKFEFQSPTDTPAGVAYRETASGFEASAPASTFILSALLGLSVLGLSYFLYRGSQMANADLSFLIVVGTVIGITSVFFLYFALGRIQVKVIQERLILSKTVFGIGFPRTFNLLKIERLRIKSRGGVRALGWGFVGSGEVKDQVCEIETDTEIRLFGAHLREQHLYYMRYLIANKIKELKKTTTDVKF